MKGRFDRRGAGPLWFTMLVVAIFVLYSATIALTTADDCGDGGDKEWQWFPPEWECISRPGFG